MAGKMRMSGERDRDRSKFEACWPGACEADVECSPGMCERGLSESGLHANAAAAGRGERGTRQTVSVRLEDLEREVEGPPVDLWEIALE